MTKKILALSLIGSIFLLNSNFIFAKDNNDTLVPDMTQEDLEKTVTRQFSYIDKRLLSGTNAQNIINSRNTDAIKALEQGKESRDTIAKQIANGQYKEAFIALRELNASLKEAIKISRAKDQAVKKIKDTMESAHIINDTYFARAKKWGLDKGDGGEEAQTLIKQAMEKRDKAEQDFKAASDGFHASTELLKKAIAAARRLNNEDPDKPKMIDQ